MSAPQSSPGQVAPSEPATSAVVPRVGSPQAGRFVRPAVAAAAALVVWGVVQTWYPFFTPSGVAKPPGASFGPVPPTEEELAMEARCAYLNATTLSGLVGGLVAASIGLVEGVRRRSARSAALAVIFGAVLGGAVGAAGGWCGQRMSELMWLHTLNTDELGDTPRIIAIEAPCWVVTGLGIGIALAIPLAGKFGATARAAVRGAAGGLLAALLYPILVVIVGILLPEGENLGFIPDVAVNRFLWLEAGAVCIALAVGAASSATPISGTQAPIAAKS